MTTVEAERFWVEAGRRRAIHTGLRDPGEVSIATAGVERCNLDSLDFPKVEVDEPTARQAISEGRGCGHCISDTLRHEMGGPSGD